MLSKSQVKYIQSLGHKKQRDEDEVFIAEGPKLVDELILADPGGLRALYAVEEWISTRPELRQLPSLTIITADELAKISQLATPNSVLGIFTKLPVRDLHPGGKITLLLDRIQDPGNLGTIIRIADWFGVKQIACAAGTADMYNPKTVQSTMGSIARVHLSYVDGAEWLSNKGRVNAYATTLEGENVRGMARIEEGIIVIGNESKGISKDILAQIDQRITIPRIGGAESLNAAVATGIVLSHLV